MSNLRILAFAGSLRAQSVNKKLIKWASSELKSMGHEVTFVDLLDYPLPLYNPDVSAEEFPKNATALAELMADHQAWLIASPEYNSSIPSCLKNVIDLVSRTPDNQHNISMFTNKVVGVISASPSSLGGARGVRHFKDILSALGSIVIPTQANIGNAYNVFDKKGDLTDVYAQKQVHATIKQLTDIAQKLA